MIKKKTRVVISLVLVAILIYIILIFTYNTSQNLSSHITLGCSVESYFHQGDIWYITLKLDNAEDAYAMKEVRIEDEKLQKKLLEVDILDIIGVNMLLTLPREKFKDLLIDDIYKINVLDLLSTTDMYDEYLVVTGISLK